MIQTVTINGINAKVFGITPLKISGHFDMPARLGTIERDWKDVDGVEAFVEYSDMFFKQRKITINFLMEASNISEFQLNLGQFRELINEKFTIVTPYGTHECLMKSGAKVDFKNNMHEENVKAQFTLIFNELSCSFLDPPTGNENITNDLFWMDFVPLSVFGITVGGTDAQDLNKSVQGNFDFPKMKTDNVTRYKRESDKVNKRATRDIILRCHLSASNLTDFSTKVSQFHGLLASAELRQLMMPIAGLEKPYGVYCPNGFKMKNFVENSNQIIGEFDLLLREAEPTPEAFYLAILLDTEGTPILTTDGLYMYIIGDRKDTEIAKLFIYTEEEEKDVFIWTPDELDSNLPNFNINANENYVYTTEEIGDQES